MTIDTENPMSPPPPQGPKLSPEEVEVARFYVLSVNLRQAKAKEESAKANRIEIEEQIAALVPGPEVGQRTIQVKDGSKLVVTRGLNYKADLDGVRDCFVGKEYPITVPIKSKTTHQLDVDGYEWYRKNHPDVFSLISEHVTATPKKVSVTLKST